MQLDQVLGRTGNGLRSVAGTTVQTADQLVRDSGVQATGRAGKPKATNPATAAPAAAVLALAALGSIVVMRVVFKGAVS